DRAAGALFERRADVHRGDRRLAVLAFADAVGARFGEQHRLLTGDVLQPRQIRAQLRLAMEIQVERADVEERQVEKLCRWEVDVGEKAVRRRGLRRLVEAAQESLDAHPPMPANHAGRDLVSECEGEYRRVIAELPDFRRELAANVALQRAVVEKRDVLRPRQPDHDVEALGRRRVEQLAPWRGVGPDRIDAELGHLAEVGGDLLNRRGKTPPPLWGKSGRGGAPYEGEFVAPAKKISRTRGAEGLWPPAGAPAR